MNDTFSPWAEIDLGAIAWNVGVIQRRLMPGVRMLVAVKGNAYGHGAVEVAQTCLRHGAQALAVARLEEGIGLREAGIRAPILILGPTPAACADELRHAALTPTITGAHDALQLNARLSAGQRLAVHLKVDTGMGRLGCFAQPLGATDDDRAQAVAQEAAIIAGLSQLHLQGVFTHFASADSADPNQTVAQFRAFTTVLDAMARLGVRPSQRHAANSAAIFSHPATHLDMVRAGIAVYGYGVPDEIGLRPAMTLKARIVQLKLVPRGATVSYGMTHRTNAPATIATVAIGYGDGYERLHSNQGHMLVRGQRAPVIGRVCMDLTMLDVSHIPGVAEGDEVVVFGRQGAAELSADAVSAAVGTIPYEVMTSLTARVRRVYRGGTSSAEMETP